MGGYGSGRHQTTDRKDTVESSLILPINKIGSTYKLGWGMYLDRVLVWKLEWSGKEVGAIPYTVDTRDRANPWIRLHYTVVAIDRSVDYRVGLTTTPLPGGGERWWFVCPLTVNGQPCGRRCGKLYLAPGKEHFGCRQCHDLTYTSAQEAHQLNTFYRDLANSFGTTPDVIKRSLKSWSSRQNWPSLGL